MRPLSWSSLKASSSSGMMYTESGFPCKDRVLAESSSETARTREDHGRAIGRVSLAFGYTDIGGSACIGMPTRAQLAAGLRLGMCRDSRAHLYGEVKRAVWCRLLEGDDEHGRVARLLKSVYGLQEAAHIWQSHWGSVLQSAGWHRGVANPARMISLASLPPERQSEPAPLLTTCLMAGPSLWHLSLAQAVGTALMTGTAIRCRWVGTWRSRWIGIANQADASRHLYFGLLLQ
eukprot:768192-Amphidinium_carterae.1